MIREFATEREWHRFHTPRSLVLAMMGELGELAEMFQWKGDYARHGGQHDKEEGLMIGWNEEKKDHFRQELADVSIYCLRLGDVCGVDDMGSIALGVTD